MASSLYFGLLRLKATCSSETSFENDASNNSFIIACIFVTAVKFPPSRCLATIGEYTDTHAHTHTERNVLS
jgi:hypothetical protein